MAKRRRKKSSKTKTRSRRKSVRRRKKKGWLGSLSPGRVRNAKPTIGQAVGKTALHVGTVVGGMAGGLILGKYSFYSGLLLTGLGVYRQNHYLALAGTGMMVAPKVKTTSPAPPVTMEGFDAKQVATEAKERVLKGFKDFSEKITFSKGEGMGGLYGNEPVTYYVNPYSSGQISPGSMPDMSALDRVQEQIAQMNGQSAGYDDDEATRIY